MTEYWYRYEDHHTASPLDEYDQPVGRGDVIIRRFQHEVVRHTAKGVWIQQVVGTWRSVDERFVLRDAFKRFACPTTNEARTSFLARKCKQLRIYTARAQDVRDTIEKAVQVFKREDTLGS